MKSVIIDRLIEIEESAQEISEGLDKKESELPVLINRKCVETENALKAAYEKKTAEIESTKERECEKKLAEIERDAHQRARKLDELFEKSHKEWENEIFKSIIGR